MEYSTYRYFSILMYVITYSLFRSLSFQFTKKFSPEISCVTSRFERMFREHSCPPDVRLTPQYSPVDNREERDPLVGEKNHRKTTSTRRATKKESDARRHPIASNATSSESANTLCFSHAVVVRHYHDLWSAHSLPDVDHFRSARTVTLASDVTLGALRATRCERQW